MNEEPKLMKMPNYSKKRLKDGMTKESKRGNSKLVNMFFCTTLVSDSLQEKSSPNGKDPMLSRRFIEINNAEGTNPKVVNGQQIKHYLRYTH